MTRRIILHVGSPKCGSTYLQRILRRNAPQLEQHGFRYPSGNGTHPGNAAELATLDQDGFQALFEGDMHTVILSHEDLYSMARRGAALQALARSGKVTVQLLAFLRPFSEFVFGDYSQFMKQFFDQYLASRTPYGGQSFDQFSLRRVNQLQPARFLQNWQDLFPETPLVLDNHKAIRPVLTRLLGSEMVLDWDLPRHETNPSLRMEDCDTIAALMRDPAVPDDEIRALFQEAFHNTSLPDPGRSEERKSLIENAFLPQNRALLKAFGYDNRLPGYPRTANKPDANPGSLPYSAPGANTTKKDHI